jgi:hypothetical protein
MLATFILNHDDKQNLEDSPSYWHFLTAKTNENLVKGRSRL